MSNTRDAAFKFVEAGIFFFVQVPNNWKFPLRAENIHCVQNWATIFCNVLQSFVDWISNGDSQFYLPSFAKFLIKYNVEKNFSQSGVLKMKNLHLKNRLIRSATWKGIAAIDGGINEKSYDIYRELAQGGVGAIITGFTSVATNDYYF